MTMASIAFYRSHIQRACIGALVSRHMRSLETSDVCVCAACIKILYPVELNI